MKNINWTLVISSVALLFLVVNSLASGFGRKEFLSAFTNWMLKKISWQKEIRELLKEQIVKSDKQYKELYDLSWKCVTTIECVQKEVQINGGSITLADVVRDLRHNQAIMRSKDWCEHHMAPYPIFRTNEDGQVDYLNRAWLEMVGCKDEKQMLGDGWLQAVPDELKDKAVDQSERISRNPVPFDGEFIFQHLVTKTVIKTHVRSELIRDEKKKVVGSLGIITIIK